MIWTAHGEGRRRALCDRCAARLSLRSVSPVPYACLQGAKLVASTAERASPVFFVYGDDHEHFHLHCVVPSLLEGQFVSTTHMH